MQFTELYDFITENTAQRSYSCLMLDIGFLSDEISKFQQDIDADHIYDEPGHGIETEYHITVKYGLHCQKYSSLKNKVQLVPVKFKIKDLSLFENENYDVLRFGITSSDLQKLNKEVCDNLDYTDSYPTYCPHSTVAYLKPGCGKKYINKKTELVGKTFESDKYVFSNKFGDKVFIKAF